MDTKPKPVVTLVSNDGFEFLVRRDCANVSPTLRKMLDPASGFAESLSSRIVFENVSAMVLDKVCEYLYFYERSRNAKTFTEPEIPPELCLELMLAADYFGI